MSRRRQARPSAPHDRHLAKRRVKLFCTGRTASRHGPHLLAQYWKRDAGRADLNGYLGAGRNSPGWSVAADGTQVLPLHCPRCPDQTPHEIPLEAVERILDDMLPGSVLRWDLSTRSVLAP